MLSHTVEIDTSERPSRLRFAADFNVAVPFIDRHIAEGRGAKVAIRTLDDAVTYADLAANVSRCAELLLRLGLERGDRTLLVVKDCPAFFYLFWGAIKAGVVPVPLNTLLRSDSYTYMIGDSGATALVYSREFADEVLPGIAGAARAPRTVAGHSSIFSNCFRGSASGCVIWARICRAASGRCWPLAVR